MAEIEMESPVGDATAPMASPPRAPTRRRETYASVQLQRAADQLQEAIQSARRRRSSASGATSLSLLLSSDDDDDEEDDTEALSDQENRTANLSGVEKPLESYARRRGRRSTLEENKLRRDPHDGTLTLKDLYASPVRKPMASSVATGEASMSPVKSGPTCQSLKLFEDSFVEKQARKALDVLENEVEEQARANKAAQEALKRIVESVDAFVAGLAARDNQVERCPAVVTVDAVKTLEEQWTESLSTWRTSISDEKRAAHEELKRYQEEMQVRLVEIQIEREEERAVHETTLATRDADLRSLQETIDSLQRLHAEDSVILQQSATHKYEKLAMENEDLRARLLAVEEEKANDVEVKEPSAEQQQRHILNLLTQLKQAELRELQWEMLFEEQTQATSQVQERLSMLFEDPHHRRMETDGSGPTMSSPAKPPTTRRESLASSTTSAELHLYQQRIEFLEDQLRDVKEQINCDHHQFLYEQQKWEYEKKHLGQDVEEVHGVSVKVLKLLLIREKLLKRQEKKMKKRVDKLHADEDMIRAQKTSLRELMETAIQECAVSLLYARQLAMSSEQSSPVKPVKLVRLLKRLKRLQDEQLDDTSCLKRHRHTPTSSSSGATARDQSN